MRIEHALESMRQSQLLIQTLKSRRRKHKKAKKSSGSGHAALDRVIPADVLVSTCPDVTLCDACYAAVTCYISRAQLVARDFALLEMAMRPTLIFRTLLFLVDKPTQAVTHL